MRLYHFLFFLCLLPFCLACNQIEKPTTQENAPSISSVHGIQISKVLLEEITELSEKPYQPFERVIEYFHKKEENESYREEIDTIRNGLFFPKIIQQRAEALFLTYSEKIQQEGNYLFLTNLTFDEEYNTYFDVVIMQCPDQFELVKRIHPFGPNYDIDNLMVIEKLKLWHQEVDFDIAVVDQDRVHAFMNKAPKDIKKFTKEVYAFCPDVIDQGYGTMNAMIKDYSENRYFWMWWD